MTSRTPLLAAGRFHLLVPAALVLTVSPALAQSTWTGGSGDWSDTGNPGWNGSAVPNAAGAIAVFNSAGTTTQDSGAGITVGTIQYEGTGGTCVIQAIDGITFDNGLNAALIENATTSTGGLLSFGATGEGLFLAGNLAIRNTNASVTGASAISFSTATGAGFHGAGNITFNNINNSLSAGAISVSGSSSFTGHVLIERGAVVYNPLAGGTPFGPSTNTITLGSAGHGSASLAQVGTNSTNIGNDIVVAAGTGGTLLLGASNNNGATTQFSGKITLNGNVSLLSNKNATATGFVLYSGTISRAGGVTTLGTQETSGYNRTRFGNGTDTVINTYSGDTILDQRSHLWLSDNAALTFFIGADDENNRITSLTTTTLLTLDGDFVFDLSGVAPVGAWTIVTLDTFGGGQVVFGDTFTVVDFTENTPGIWSRDFNGTTYTFTEATGILQAVPEPSSTFLLVLGGEIVLGRRTVRAR
jgi:hypothetical protein